MFYVQCQKDIIERVSENRREAEKKVFEELLSIAHFVSLFRARYNGSVEA
jgi:hypothetical protein